jgi:hypothetical protein
MNWCFCKTLQLFPPKTWLHLFAFILQFLIKSFLCECITVSDRIFNVILWRVSDLTLLIAGLDRKLDISGDTTSVKLRVCLDFNECRMFPFLCSAGGGGVWFTVGDKSCTIKIIYLTYKMKHHCMKTCWRIGDKAPRNLAVNEDELSASRYGEFSVSGRLPTFPLKGMSAVWTTVI